MPFIHIYYFRHDTAEEQTIEKKQYYIECKGDETFWIEADGDTTIDKFKAKIEVEQGIAADEQRLVFAGKQLDGSNTISKIVKDAGEVETARVHFILESTGGGNYIHLNMEAF